MVLHTIRILFISLAVLMGSASLTMADGGTIFFAALVEKSDQATPQVVLEWGGLDGELPSGITAFKLYRSVNGAGHQWLADISHTLADINTLNSIAENDLSSRFSRLIDNLNRMSISEGGQAIDSGNFASYLHELMSPTSPAYNPLKVLLLSRAHLNAARGLGLAYIDDSVLAASSYHYILTAVTAGGESQPIGQSDIVAPGLETVLPAPTGLTQVRLSSCSPLGGGLDDNKINFRWDIPAEPQDIGLKAMTYGYELFWSAADLGIIDFRQGIPANLHRVNQEPVVMAGPVDEDGPDSYLAKDGKENHVTSEQGPEWRPGQSYFYYLTARDIAGHYSAPVSAVQLTVEDGQPPRTIWNSRVSEIKDPLDNLTPRLALVWDAPTSLNFARYYGSNRNICSATVEEVCWVGPEQSCTTDTPRCADLAVDHYRIFRFDSPQQAAQWGIDTDGDGWPDNLEDDPCDPTLHPEGSRPRQWIATVSPDDPQFSRDLNETHRQIIYIDRQEPGIPELNKVYWYKVLAVDTKGNQSPLSPPLRGVLYDRSQPDPSAVISRQVCNYSSGLPGDCDPLQPLTGDSLIVLDNTGKATSYKLYQSCGFSLLAGGPVLQLLDSGQLDSEGVGHIKISSLPIDETCTLPLCNVSSKLFVSFYDENGGQVAYSLAFVIKNACSYLGCITLEESCSWEEITGNHPLVDGPVQVCVPLEAGQSARVYYDTAEGMSAFHTFPPATVSGEVCAIFDDLAGLTPDDICLGVRTFSANHVGSAMQQLGCLELRSQNQQPPPRPLLDAPEAVRTDKGDFFNLHWSMPTAGIGSYILKFSSEGSSSYQSLWNLQPDDTGRYPYPHPLGREDMAKEWCFQVRALATDMQASDWSNEQCDTWYPGARETLPWPPVAEPEVVEGESLGAFYMETAWDHYPVLVLSNDLTAVIQNLPSCGATYCNSRGTVTSSPCMEDRELLFYNCPAADLIRHQIVASSFIVYRQESGHDFVQVSPLIEGFHSVTTISDKLIPVDHIQDPFITFLDVYPEVVTGVGDPEAIGAGIRVLFKDRYPFSPGSRIRYKLVSIHQETGEPEQVFTSNWVDIP